MKKQILLALALLTLSPTAIANRCAGEASFAVAECACTVRNRLEAGWTWSKVLDAYYAADIPATPAQVRQVAAVLDGGAACDGEMYFMYSAADVRALGLERFEPTAVVRSGGREVRFYGRWFRQGGLGR